MRGRRYSSWAISTWIFARRVQDDGLAIADRDGRDVLEVPRLRRGELRVDDEHRRARRPRARGDRLRRPLAEKGARIRLGQRADLVSDDPPAVGPDEGQDLGEL
jgi:hypothetical protein